MKTNWLNFISCINNSIRTYCQFYQNANNGVIIIKKSSCDKIYIYKHVNFGKVMKQRYHFYW
jgi:hypothetical protein